MKSRLVKVDQYTDPETGLIYLQARYYDPTTAQFLTRDPLDAETQSAYGYVNGNPLNGTDPTGLAGPQNPPDEGSPEAGRPPAPPDPAVWATNDPALSNAEKQALRDKAAGVPYDTAAANSAAQKLKTGQKVRGERGFSGDSTVRRPNPFSAMPPSGEQVLNGSYVQPVVVGGIATAGILGFLWWLLDTAPAYADTCSP